MPAHLFGNPAPAAVDPSAVARAEVAATVAVAATPLTAGRARRASAASWRGTTVLGLALVMLACAAAGFVALRSHGDAQTRAQAAVAVPGTGLAVDKPDGWVAGPVDAAPSVLTTLVDVADGGGQGLFFTAPGGRALFVIEAPNSADLDAVPPVPDHIGTASVIAQTELEHGLGPARNVRAESRDPGQPFGLDATYVLTEGRIVVVGGFAEGGLDTGTTAAAAGLLASLHSR